MTSPPTKRCQSPDLNDHTLHRIAESGAPALSGDQPCEPTAGHPAWCRGDDDAATHEGRRYTVRNRDGVQVELYLVDYGFSLFLALDVTVDVEASLIEFTIDEATQLYTVLGGLLNQVRNTLNRR